MIQIIRKNYDELLKVLIILGLIGVFYSTALTTASIVVITIIAVIASTNLSFRKVIADRLILPLTLVFLVILVSGLYSQDTAAWQTAVRIKLPFFILPVAFIFSPHIDKRFALSIHYWLVLISVMVGLPVMMGILRDMNQATDLISVGKSVYTPIEHVKYSMTVAYAAISAWLLYRHDEHKSAAMRWILLSGMVILVAVLHLMAVRTGLVIFYISLVVLAVIYSTSKLHRKVGISLMVGLVVLPIVAVQVLPTLKQKIGYMRYDWQQHEQGVGQLYSDSERLLSYKAGISIFKNSPWIGVGYGDVRSAAKDYYKEVADRPDVDKLPHSQYLTYLSGVGIIGFLIWIFGFYRPLYGSIRYSKDIYLYLIIFLYLNYSLSFLVENSLDRSMSVAFLLLLVLPLLKVSSNRKPML